MGLFGFGKKKEENNSGCGCSCSCSQGHVVLILGGGCKNCHTLEDNTRAALQQLGVSASIEHVTDFAQIAQYGVMRTPALVVDGKVLSSGRVLSPEEAAKLLKDSLS